MLVPLYNPVFNAIYNNEINTLELLLTLGHSMYEDSGDGKHNISYALHNKNGKIIQLLLEFGMSVNKIEAQLGSENILTWAILNQCKSLAEYVVEIEPNSMLYLNNSGNSPLHLAADKNWDDFIEVLLEKGADINQQNYAGQTPLMLAILRESGRAVRVLLENGASIHEQSKTGDTALFYAVFREWIELCALLIELGADKHHLNEAGKSPLHEAYESENPELLACMLKQ